MPITKLLNSSYINDLEKNAEKAFILGWMLTNISDDEADFKLGVHYYCIAASLGNVQAAFNYARIHEVGMGAEQNSKEAFHRMQKLAEGTDYARAWSTLGWYYGHGIGTKKNPELEEECYIKAVQKGHAPAACNLAYIYLGFPISQEKAKQVDQNKLAQGVEYLKEAANSPHAGALCLLGLLYAEGIYFQMNLNKAHEYMLKAATLDNHPVAIDWLIVMYSHNQSPFYDPDKEEEWREKKQMADPVRTERTPLFEYRKYQACIAVGGYEFRDSRLFLAAMVRPSALKNDIIDSSFLTGVPSSDKLEWIGDSVLNATIREALAKLHPSKTRSEFHLPYQKFICNANSEHRHGGALYRVAKALKLENLLIQDKDDPITRMPRRGSHKSKKTVECQLSNHMEMLIGAIKEDGGEQASKQFILTHWRKVGLNEAEESDEEFGASDTDDNEKSISSSFALGYQ